MSVILKKHVEKFVNIDEAAFQEVLAFFDMIPVKKKENLMEEGEFCNYHFFVEQGCIRKFFLKENGMEQTTEFALEHWWMTDNFAFERREQSGFYIQAIEPSVVLRISHDNRAALLREFPFMEHYFRMIYQRAYAAAERRIRFLYELSREDLYLHFADSYPQFVQRIPQYLLASFLGFTPEYLSEIRNKLRS